MKRLAKTARGTSLVKTLDSARSEKTDAALYEEAQAIVNAAKAASGGDPLAPESYLYNYISLVAVCDGSANEPVRNERTALDERMTVRGALLSGRANCQGFSDAFYLPASLSGFVVRWE